MDTNRTLICKKQATTDYSDVTDRQRLRRIFSGARSFCFHSVTFNQNIFCQTPTPTATATPSPTASECPRATPGVLYIV